jgi:hypothetical protein
MVIRPEGEQPDPLPQQQLPQIYPDDDMVDELNFHFAAQEETQGNYNNDDDDDENKTM